MNSSLHFFILMLSRLVDLRTFLHEKKNRVYLNTVFTSYFQRIERLYSTLFLLLSSLTKQTTAVRELHLERALLQFLNDIHGQVLLLLNVDIIIYRKVSRLVTTEETFKVDVQLFLFSRQERS
jgi:hypothetical protein